MFLQVSDTLKDNYETRPLAEAALARTKVGTIIEKKGKDGEIVGFAHEIPFKRWTVSSEGILEDVKSAVETLGADKVAKILNSGLDLHARQIRRAELKENEPGKKAARTAAQLWINSQAFEKGELSHLKQFSEAMKAGTAEANAYLDALVESDEYKASQA